MNVWSVNDTQLLFTITEEKRSCLKYQDSEPQGRVNNLFENISSVPVWSLGSSEFFLDDFLRLSFIWQNGPQFPVESRKYWKYFNKHMKIVCSLRSQHFSNSFINFIQRACVQTRNSVLNKSPITCHFWQMYLKPRYFSSFHTSGKEAPTWCFWHKLGNDFSKTSSSILDLLGWKVGYYLDYPWPYLSAHSTLVLLVSLNADLRKEVAAEFAQSEL